MASSIRAALQSTKIEWIDCEKCHKRTPFAIPNMFERVKAAQLVLSELEGKVGTHREAPAPVKVSGDLGELTDEQLLELLQAPEPDDVEESDESADLG